MAMTNRSPAFSDERLAGRERTGPDLRPAQVLQDADVAAGALGGFAHLMKERRVIGLRAMREVEPDDVDAGGDERVEHVRIAGRRSERGDDLCASHGDSLYNQRSE